jgi:aryl-alcohol dehydrogenase-like predicted oxidoreductase
MRNVNQKICLGSANFGLQYGIYSKKVSFKKINKILIEAKKNKIEYFDTAFSYGNAEKIIGQILSKNKYNVKILSKLDPSNIKKSNVSSWFFNSLFSTLKNLNQKSLYGMYIHNENQLLGPEGKKIFELLEISKKLGLIENIGISIYNKKNLDKLLKKYKFDIVQLPVSLLDQRLIKDGTLKKIKLRKIKIFARSIFLKKILLLEAKKRPKYFEKWRFELAIYDKYIEKNRISKLDACIQFVSSIKEIDNIIVGTSDLCQFKKINRSIKKKKKLKTKLILKIKNKQNFEKLVNPQLWKLK